MAKRRIVGLLVMTELPGMGLVAVLQRRGEFNHEKLEKILHNYFDKPNSFLETNPGSLQLTVWGGVKECESVPEALFREMREEMGEALPCEVGPRSGSIAPERYRPATTYQEFGENWMTPVEIDAPSESEALREIYRFEDEKNLKVAFYVKLGCEFLKYIRLSPSSGGIRFLTEGEIDKIQDLKNFDKVAGVADRNVLAMYADIKETIRRAFELAKK